MTEPHQHAPVDYAAVQYVEAKRPRRWVQITIWSVSIALGVGTFFGVQSVVHAVEDGEMNVVMMLHNGVLYTLRDFALDPSTHTEFIESFHFTD